MSARPSLEIGASAMRIKFAIAVMALVAVALIVPDHEVLARGSHGGVRIHGYRGSKRPPPKPPCPAYAMTVLYGCVY